MKRRRMGGEGGDGRGEGGEEENEEVNIRRGVYRCC